MSTYDETAEEGSVEASSTPGKLGNAPIDLYKEIISIARSPIQLYQGYAPKSMSALFTHEIYQARTTAANPTVATQWSKLHNFQWLPFHYMSLSNARTAAAARIQYRSPRPYMSLPSYSGLLIPNGRAVTITTDLVADFTGLSDTTPLVAMPRRNATFYSGWPVESLRMIATTTTNEMGVNSTVMAIALLQYLAACEYSTYVARDWTEVANSIPVAATQDDPVGVTLVGFPGAAPNYKRLAALNDLGSNHAGAMWDAVSIPAMAMRGSTIAANVAPNTAAAAAAGVTYMNEFKHWSSQVTAAAAAAQNHIGRWRFPTAVGRAPMNVRASFVCSSNPAHLLPGAEIIVIPATLTGSATSMVSRNRMVALYLASFYPSIVNPHFDCTLAYELAGGYAARNYNNVVAMQSPSCLFAGTGTHRLRYNSSSPENVALFLAPNVTNMNDDPTLNTTFRPATGSLAVDLECIVPNAAGIFAAYDRVLMVGEPVGGAVAGFENYTFSLAGWVASHVNDIERSDVIAMLEMIATVDPQGIVDGMDILAGVAAAFPPMTADARDAAAGQLAVELPGITYAKALEAANVITTSKFNTDLDPTNYNIAGWNRTDSHMVLGKQLLVGADGRWLPFRDYSRANDTIDIVLPGFDAHTTSKVMSGMAKTIDPASPPELPLLMSRLRSGAMPALLAAESWRNFMIAQDYLVARDLPAAMLNGVGASVPIMISCHQDLFSPDVVAASRGDHGSLVGRTLTSSSLATHKAKGLSVAIQQGYLGRRIYQGPTTADQNAFDGLGQPAGAAITPVDAPLPAAGFYSLLGGFAAPISEVGSNGYMVGSDFVVLNGRRPAALEYSALQFLLYKASPEVEHSIVIEPYREDGSYVLDNYTNFAAANIALTKPGKMSLDIESFRGKGRALVSEIMKKLAYGARYDANLADWDAAAQGISLRRSLPGTWNDISVNYPAVPAAGAVRTIALADDRFYTDAANRLTASGPARWSWNAANNAFQLDTRFPYSDLYVSQVSLLTLTEITLSTTMARMIDEVFRYEAVMRSLADQVPRFRHADGDGLPSLRARTVFRASVKIPIRVGNTVANAPISALAETATAPPVAAVDLVALAAKVEALLAAQATATMVRDPVTDAPRSAGEE